MVFYVEKRLVTVLVTKSNNQNTLIDPPEWLGKI